MVNRTGEQPHHHSDYRQRLGRRGEEAAEVFLVKQGLEPLTRNARTRYGELDLVMRQADEVVFVEVKTRTGENFGLPEDAVNANKQKHLIESAEAYMSEHAELGSGWRIDVVAIRYPRQGRKIQIEWFENAISG